MSGYIEIVSECVQIPKKELEQLRAELEAARAKLAEYEWINVEDRLPDVNQTVAFVNNGLVYIGSYEDICGNLFFTFNLYQDDYWGKGSSPMTARKVSEWMPLPAPPIKDKRHEDYRHV